MSTQAQGGDLTPKGNNVSASVQLLIKCQKAGLIDDKAFKKLKPLIDEDYMADTVKKFTHDLALREQAIIGEQYQIMQTASDEERARIMLEFGIKTVTFTVDEVTKKLKIYTQKNVPTAVRIPGDSTKGTSKATGITISNGVLSFTSLASMCEHYDESQVGKSKNGETCLGKIRAKITVAEAEAFNVTDKEGIVKGLPLWSSEKYGVEFTQAKCKQ